MLLAPSGCQHALIHVHRAMPLNDVTILIELLVEHLDHCLCFLWPRGLGSLSVCQLCLSLLNRFLLERHLGLMVQSIVDCLLTLLAARLRVHELRFPWVLCLGDLICDFLGALGLAISECVLVSEELPLSAAPLPLLLINLGLEVAILGQLRVHFLHESFFIKFADPFALPGGESVDVLLGCLLRGKFFLQE